MSLEERVMELESRMAFQDDTIQALNDVLVKQRRELDHLQLQMAAMLKRQEENGQSVRDLRGRCAATSLLIGCHKKNRDFRQEVAVFCCLKQSAAGQGCNDIFGLQAFVAVHHGKFDALSFDQYAMTLTANGAKMHENIVAGIPGDEAEALGGVEPLYGASITISHIVALRRGRGGVRPVKADAQVQSDGYDGDSQAHQNGRLTGDVG